MTKYTQFSFNYSIGALKEIKKILSNIINGW